VRDGEATAADDDAGLPEPLARVLGDYERHLRAERDLTPHTVRAYVTDLVGLLDHAARLGITQPAELDLRTLRSWLAKQQTLGRSRTTIARRATAARVFTAWLARTGRAPTDVGASLGSPRAHKSLPPVLRADEAESLIRAATEHADDGSPVGLRDVAMLELLYATGIRVGELVGLDVDDVDRERNVVRVFGKGRKERTVPFGRPAARALDFWVRQ
jgi:integrase/recombinase XerC